jgi:hypothetical protein
MAQGVYAQPGPFSNHRYPRRMSTAGESGRCFGNGANACDAPANSAGHRMHGFRFVVRRTRQVCRPRARERLNGGCREAGAWRDKSVREPYLARR